MATSDYGSLASVTATINYTRRRDPAERSRDYSVSGDMENREKGTNHAGRALLEPHAVHVHDARPLRQEFALDVHGFCLAELHSALPPSLDVLLAQGEAQIRETYWPEVEELVRRTVRVNGRPPKYVFAIGTQKFTEDRSRGFLGSYSRQAHADFSEAVFGGAHKMLVKRGVPEAEARAVDIVFVNSWQPFGREVRDNPLALLDWRSVDPEMDLVERKRGAATKKGHIYTTAVRYNPGHRWVYISRMQTHEIWLFKQADSRSAPGLAKYAFHTSFRDPTAQPGAPGLICGCEALPRASAL